MYAAEKIHYAVIGQSASGYCLESALYDVRSSRTLRLQQSQQHSTFSQSPHILSGSLLMFHLNISELIREDICVRFYACLQPRIGFRSPDLRIDGDF